MEVLHLLATALGISAMAGINLYLTVFATSLALNTGWLHLSPQMQSLQVLGDPAILMISGGLYFLEFFVDKIPGLDSLWDAVHTAIRPLGAMFMSLALLGQTNLTLEIVTALLCGSVALSTHATKLGIRAVINTSPEPFSNMAASVTEDIMVGGGLALSYTHPLVAAAGVLIFLVAFIWFSPRLFRFVRMVFVFGWSRLSIGGQGTGLGIDIRTGHREQLGQHLGAGKALSWCVRGFTAKSSMFPAGLVCYLFRVAPDTDADEQGDREAAGPELGLFLPSKKQVLWLELESLELSVRTKFLYCEFVFYHTVKQESLKLRFSRRDCAVLRQEISAMQQGKPFVPDRAIQETRTI